MDPDYGFVYLVGSRKYNWYKIGASLEPSKRISGIRTVCPFDIDTFATKQLPDYYKFEQFLHQRYKGNRLRGEWFEFTPEELEEVATFISKGVRHAAKTESPKPRNEPLFPVPPTILPEGLQKIGGPGSPELFPGRGAENIHPSDAIQLVLPSERHPGIPSRIPTDSEQYREYLKHI